jgi:virginiamycin A acetyltransferase
MTVVFSPKARISSLADIEDSVRGTRIVVEDDAVIDAFVKIKSAGGSGDVVIGRDTIVNSGTVIYSGNGVRLGAHVRVAANCTFAATNHEVASRDQLIRDQGFKPSRGGIVVEDDVWIGANCVILDGAILRQGCVIGAGAVVRGEIGAYTIQAGTPLRQIGMRK